jgi:hypothetical protein
METKIGEPTIKPHEEAVGSDGLPPLAQVDAEVLLAIRNIRYGSVEITIHDSRVVQIERKEKRRFGQTNGR